jgi:GTPase SAR1 family protein
MKIKILVIGDELVGKSSLIATYISRQYISSNINSYGNTRRESSVLPYEILPGIFDKNIEVTLMDSSSHAFSSFESHFAEANAFFTQQLKDADSVLALYDTTRLETLSNLSKKWLPIVEDVINQSATDETNANRPNKPVVIVGTKTDLLQIPLNHSEKVDSEPSQHDAEIEALKSVLNRFPFAQICCRLMIFS